MTHTAPLSLYIAASFRHLHTVHLLGSRLRDMGYYMYDWTEKGTPPEGLNAAERREWMDTDNGGGEIFSFCADACHKADLLIYLGASGQDAGVEVGMAYTAGLPILGICGPLEPLGLMLHGAATIWVDTTANALAILKTLMEHAKQGSLSREHIIKHLEAYENLHIRSRRFP